MQPAAPGANLTRYSEYQDSQRGDQRPVVSWARQHTVLAVGLAMIAAGLIWKADFLSHLYFRQDDFHDLDLAVGAPLSWRYLTFVGAGHLIIGLRVIAWFLVRASLYNWPLASFISLVFVAAANLAALRLLRLMFGERPAILIPLLIYSISPLTFPDLGEWSSALESVPLQLAIFLALYSHIRYVRSGRNRHLVAAAGWIAFGLLFFEKGLVLPFLLFGFTALFLTERGSVAGGALAALRGYWRAWAAYAAMMAGYLVLLAVALHTSTTHPGAPSSAGQVASFTTGLLRNSLVPGIAGGPWQWLPVPGNSYSFAAAPPSLTWLALLAVAALVALTIWLRREAWRAWVILAGWVIVADMLPVVISRLGAFSAGVLGTETRYVADAVPVLAICVALAFWPMAPAEEETVAAATPGYQLSGTVAAILIGIFAIGSIWSVQDYENVTTGAQAATYIANARQAVRLVPRGTVVMNVDVPGNMVEGLFGSYANESTVIGDLAPGRLDWTSHPHGTIENFRIFGGNGKLYQAFVYGTKSLPLAAGQKCWPARHHRVVVRFAAPSPPYTGMLRIGYLWYGSGSGTVSVRAGAQTGFLAVKAGLHAGYVPITGSVSKVTINVAGASGLCVGDAEAGNLGPDSFGVVLP